MKVYNISHQWEWRTILLGWAEDRPKCAVDEKRITPRWRHKISVFVSIINYICRNIGGKSWLYSLCSLLNL